MIIDCISDSSDDGSDDDAMMMVMMTVWWWWVCQYVPESFVLSGFDGEVR